MSSEPEDDDLVISVRGVSKAYAIYDKPLDRLKQFFWQGTKQFYKPFWALRDVSFEVRRGESVGIVGRNGSGKSTLLQIIAGTLTPSSGEVEIRGRIAALLELGTGFNFEFTGRENVYLNGAIMGISRAEMEKRFDEIADFADIGEYIDQPVKTYSSGMFARLAFAVAVCIEPDILIVDEILSVGDMAFQQKCVSRMRQMRDNGLTLIFVSHSPDTVKSICQRGLFLIRGQSAYWGPAEQAVNLYFNFIREQTNKEAIKSQVDISKPVQFSSKVEGLLRYGTGHVQIQKADLLNSAGESTRAFQFGESIVLEATVKSHLDIENLSVSFLVRDMAGIDLMGTTTFDERCALPPLAAGEQVRVRFQFANCLREGNYGISLAINRVSQRDLSDNVLFDQVDGCAAFAVIPNPERPVYYKFHTPIQIECSPVESDRAAVPKTSKILS